MRQSLPVAVENAIALEPARDEDVREAAHGHVHVFIASGNAQLAVSPMMPQFRKVVGKFRVDYNALSEPK